MLLLTRKRAEKIQIGEDIVIQVNKIGKLTVKIGIEAPSEVRVTRGELIGQGSQKPATGVLLTEKPMAMAACSDRFPHTVQIG